MSKSKIHEIKKLASLSLGSQEIVFMYLGYSGVIVRTANHTLIIDPADLVTKQEITALKDVDLLLYTHNHRDHFHISTATDIFTVTHAPILAEPLVVDELTNKIPANKLTNAIPGKTYIYNEINVATIQGIHRGPINLYHISLGAVTIFHGGDSGYIPVKDYPANLAFLPTGTPSPTASPDYAFKLASELRPKVIVAFHGSHNQSKELENKVKEGLPETAVIISEPNLSRKVSL